MGIIVGIREMVTAEHIIRLPKLMVVQSAACALIYPATLLARLAAFGGDLALLATRKLVVAQHSVPCITIGALILATSRILLLLLLKPEEISQSSSFCHPCGKQIVKRSCLLNAHSIPPIQESRHSPGP